MIPSTFAALTVAVLAILPGAAYIFAFESRAGAFRLSAPDRILRFVVASAAFHALVSGLTYYLYRTRIRTGELANGKINSWVVELVALIYLVVPYLAGLVAALPRIRRTPLVKPFAERDYHPRAWDFLFSQGIEGIIRIRLKSGSWIAGSFRTIPDTGEKSYASGYGQDSDLYLTETVAVDAESGAFLFDDDNNVVVEPGAILIRWNEVEFAQIFKGDRDDQS